MREEANMKTKLNLSYSGAVSRGGLDGAAVRDRITSKQIKKRIAAAIRFLFMRLVLTAFPCGAARCKGCNICLSF